MLLLGCKPGGRYTEQHDVYFGIGEKIRDLVPGIVEFWPEANGKIHVDAWREVTALDGHSIDIIKTDLKTQEANRHKIFFLNLGGYKAHEFEEYHYKMLCVAPDKGMAVQLAKQTAFYKHTGFSGAESHIDDKYGVDVDDVYQIEDILPRDVKQKYSIVVSPVWAGHNDELHLGYFQLHKL